VAGPDNHDIVIIIKLGVWCGVMFQFCDFIIIRGIVLCCFPVSCLNVDCTYMCIYDIVCEHHLRSVL